MKILQTCARAVLAASLYGALASAVVAAPRFEVVDNVLFDAQTGLKWQSLNVTANLPRPLSDSVLGDGWMIASSNQVFNLLVSSEDYYFQPFTVNIHSDLFTAISFFASSASANTCNTNAFSNAFFDGLPVDGCFNGHDLDNNNRQPYAPSTSNLLHFVGSYRYDSTNPDLVNVAYTSTLGDCYNTDSYACTTDGGLFAVAAIPEPQTFALLMLGLGAIAVRRKWAKPS